MKLAKNLYRKLKDRLTSTHRSIVEKTENLFRRFGKIDEDLLEGLEEALIEADVGVDIAIDLVDGEVLVA